MRQDVHSPGDSAAAFKTVEVLRDIWATNGEGVIQSHCLLVDYFQKVGLSSCFTYQEECHKNSFSTLWFYRSLCQVLVPPMVIMREILSNGHSFWSSSPVDTSSVAHWQVFLLRPALMNGSDHWHFWKQTLYLAVQFQCILKALRLLQCICKGWMLCH